MTLKELYYYHETINRLYFNGSLEAVIIKTKTDNYDDPITASTETTSDPFIIWIDKDILRTSTSISDKLFVLTVLFHEMIHQYNAENCVEDTDDSGEHLQEFVDSSYEHGMLQNGYALSDKVRDTLISYIRKYEIVNRFKY